MEGPRFDAEMSEKNFTKLRIGDFEKQEIPFWCAQQVEIQLLALSYPGNFHRHTLRKVTLNIFKESVRC